MNYSQNYLLPDNESWRHYYKLRLEDVRIFPSGQHTLAGDPTVTAINILTFVLPHRSYLLKEGL